MSCDFHSSNEENDDDCELPYINYDYAYSMLGQLIDYCSDDSKSKNLIYLYNLKSNWEKLYIINKANKSVQTKMNVDFKNT